MIASIKNMISEMTRFHGGVAGHLMDVAKKHEDTILDLNTESQLFEKGETGEGTPITPAYRPFTVRIKKQKGQPTNRVTLRDSGDFHKSFRVIFSKTQFRITADDEKTQKLVDKYGGQILGLSEDSLDTLAEGVKPDMIKKTREVILG